MSGSMDFGAVWDALPMPAILCDPSGTVVQVNGATESLVSSSSRSINGKPLAKFVGESSIVLAAVKQTTDSPATVVQHDIEFAWADRIVRLSMLQAMQIGDEAGHILLLLSPRSLAEKMDRSLGYRAAARSVTGMAAMLAHEIRNPLAGIKGAAQLLAMNLDVADQEFTTLIEEEAERIGKLVERVEQFGDLRPAELKPVNIHDVLHRAITAARAGYANHIRIKEEYDPSLPPTAADGDRLIQVFQNLLKNAAEAAPSVGGLIGVRTGFRTGIKMSMPGNKASVLPLEVIISDNGAGIPPDLIDNIFEPFVSSKVNGSGLGLSLVSKILADHGGVIECESDEGRTEFRILLPVWNEPKTTNEQTGEA